jgi:uncharacterized protein
MTSPPRGSATRMTVYLNDGDRSGHQALFSEIVHRAHEHGLAGASVLHGVEGYGASGFVHTTRLLDCSDDLPAVVVIVDTDDKIRSFLPQLEELVGEGLVTLEPVEIVRRTGAGAAPA